MKKNYLLTISILITLILSACGAEATPTISAEDLAGTVMADAWIAITQTQAALPTATPIPPTITLAPTATFPPTLPPLPTLTPATVVAAATTGTCIEIPQPKPKGTQVNVEFQNESKGQVNLSFGMNTANNHEECFTYSFGLGDGGVISAKVLAGCYWGYAWITGNEPSVARTGSTILCMNDVNLIYHVVITKERIEFK